MLCSIININHCVRTYYRFAIYVCDAFKHITNVKHLQVNGKQLLMYIKMSTSIC